MINITPELVLRPAPHETRWLVGALPFTALKAIWLATTPFALAMLASYILSGRMVPGSRLLETVVLAGTCSSLAPVLRRSLIAHTVRSLRKRHATACAALSRQCTRVNATVWLTLLGVWLAVAGANLLAACELWIWCRCAITMAFAIWAILGLRLLIVGWAVLIIGERCFAWASS